MAGAMPDPRLPSYPKNTAEPLDQYSFPMQQKVGTELAWDTCHISRWFTYSRTDGHPSTSALTGLNVNNWLRCCD